MKWTTRPMCYFVGKRQDMTVASLDYNNRHKRFFFVTVVVIVQLNGIKLVFIRSQAIDVRCNSSLWHSFIFTQNRTNCIKIVFLLFLLFFCFHWMDWAICIWHWKRICRSYRIIWIKCGKWEKTHLHTKLRDLRTDRFMMRAAC